MKSTTIKLALGLFCAVLLLALSSCETNEIAGPTNQDLNLAQTEGLSTSEINWIPVKPEMLEKVRALSKTGDAGKMITPQAGGIVGGNMTLDNLVHIPPYAIDEKEYVTVEVLCIEDKLQTGAGVEFLPGITFNKYVDLTLSWAFLDLEDGEEVEFKIYFSEDGGSVWFLLAEADMVIDYGEKTVSFQTDHFTRYAWGI